VLAPFAVSVAEVPGQMVASFTLITGKGLTNIETAEEVSEHPLASVAMTE